MNKKFYEIKKCEGITTVYFIIKSRDINQNKRFEINADEFLSLNNTLIDYSTNKYIFYAKDVELVKTEKFVIEMYIKDEPNSFRKVLPVPIRSFFKSGYDEFYKRVMDENPDCFAEIIQFYKYGK